MKIGKVDTSASQQREWAHRAEEENDEERMKDDKIDGIGQERHKQEVDNDKEGSD